VARTRDTGSLTVVERFVKALVVTAKAVVLYPPDSNVPVETAYKAAGLLGEAMRTRSQLRLTVSPDAVWHRNEKVFPGDPAYAAFASELYARGLVDVRFHAGMSPRDLVAFLSLLKYSPEEARSIGGFEARLWERGVSSISVAPGAEVALEAPPATGSQRHSHDLADSSVLDEAGVERLLAYLAQEQDAATRTEIVETLSRVASQHVSTLGKYVTDPRWYVVRNVVAIMGAARSPETLPFMAASIAHPEARVRREAIRALRGLDSPEATAMLAGALDDDDPQNVQLAARYLGVLRSADAIPALEKVALGEGRGNRDMGPRVEAIEALGQIGSPDALPTLEQLAGRRALLGRGKGMGLRTAARSAIVEITDMRTTK